MADSSSLSQEAADKNEISGGSLRSRSMNSSAVLTGKGTTGQRRKLIYLTSSRKLIKDKRKEKAVDRTDSVPRGRVLQSTTDETAAESINIRGEGSRMILNTTSISKRYQPKNFQEISGHGIIVKALSSAVHKKKIAPLYLFHGLSGTGKTSTARIFAMALNCESTSHALKPCCNCKGCSRSLYVMELCSGGRIDGFGKIKTLLQSTSFTQAIPGLKVLIIEECQSFTAEAWDELLGIIEGQYGSTLVFVLITIDASKVAGNISSRCQKFYFSKLKDDDIFTKLSKILIQEGIGIEKEALKLIVAKSEGSLRDAENILDQLALLESTISSSMVQQLVGLVPQNKLIDLLVTAASGDTVKTIIHAKELIAGVEPLAFVSQLATLITDILSETAVVDSSPSLPSPSARSLEDKRVSRSRSHLTKKHSARLCYALKILSEVEKQLSTSTDQTSAIIAAFLEITSENACNGISSGDVSEPSRSSIKSKDKTERSQGKEIKEKTNLASMSDMEKLWTEVLEGIENADTKNFLLHQVKLASISISRTNAIVHLIFRRPEDKMSAQISEESLAKALEVAIGHPVTVNMSLEPFAFELSQKAQESCSLSESLRLQKSKSCSSEAQYRNQSSRKEWNTDQLQPSSGLRNLKDYLATADPEIKNLIQARHSIETAQAMRTNKPTHRWLSLSSIPQSDASVEPYSQDVLYENSSKDRESKARRYTKFQQSFSKSSVNRYFGKNARQLKSNPTWSCIDVCCMPNTQV